MRDRVRLPVLSHLRPLAIAHVFVLAAGCREPSPPPTDGAADRSDDPDAVCDPGEASVAAAPRDRWSPRIVFRETTLLGHARPPGGWYVTPVHAHVLPDGRVLLHGEMKDQIRGARDSEPISNDIQWVVDPSLPEPREDGDQTIRPILPWQQWRGDPNGTQTNPEGVHGVGVPTEELMCGGTTWLADGRLLYAGGGGSYTEEPPQAHSPIRQDGTFVGGHWKSAFLDPRGDLAGGGWRVGPPMLQGMRYYGTATRLADGDVLMVGGYYDLERYGHTGIERLAVRANAWRTLVPSLGPRLEIPRGDARAGLPSHPDDYPHVFLLPTALPAALPAAAGLAREVAVVGRWGDVSFVSVDAGDGVARIVRQEAWRRPDDPDDPTEERMHGASSVLLPDGRIGVGSGSDSAAVGARFDVFDPRPDAATFGTWRSIPLCADPGRCHARIHGAAVLTPDGGVLLLAGRLARADVPGDPRTPIFIDVGAGMIREGSPWPEAEVRGYHTVAVMVPDGRVLLAGGRGYRWERCNSQSSEEYCEDDERPDMRWYSPPWLDPSLAPFRPRITDDPRGVDGSAAARDLSLAVLRYDREYDLPVSTERPRSCPPALSAVLMGLPSQTHSFDMNQRLIPLTTSWRAGDLRIRMPARPSAAPPGPYMLIVLRPVRVLATGSTVQVPSIARTVMLR